MHVNIRCRPAYALAYVTLSYGEKVYVERSAMATMSGGLDLHTGFGGEGVGRAIKRRYLGGETLLFNECVAEVEGAWIAVAPRYPGDVEVIEVSAEKEWLIEAGSLLAYSEGVHSDVRFSGLRTMVMHEGVTLIEVAGLGEALVSSYGGIEELTVGPGEQLIVDTGHIVAFSKEMQFDVGPLGSFRTAVLSGEGIVARFTGPGRVLIQTRAEAPFRQWLLPDQFQNTGR